MWNSIAWGYTDIAFSRKTLRTEQVVFKVKAVVKTWSLSLLWVHTSPKYAIEEEAAARLEYRLASLQTWSQCNSFQFDVVVVCFMHDRPFFSYCMFMGDKKSKQCQFRACSHVSYNQYSRNHFSDVHIPGNIHDKLMLGRPSKSNLKKKEKRKMSLSKLPIVVGICDTTAK